MKIKLLLLVFAVVFTTANLHAADFTVDGIAYTITYGSYTVAVSKKSPIYTGTITIPASVIYNSISYSVTSIGDFAFDGCTGLTSITIPNSVTSIGHAAFQNCTGLTSVTIPNSVTSIGEYAFNFCAGLTLLTIGNSVTFIGEAAFEGCSGLTSITLPNSVTSIGDKAFHSCSVLASVTIPSLVTSIGFAAFYNCTGLTSVTIPNSVTAIGSYAFYNCTGLSAVTIPNSVAYIKDWTFYNCTSLTSVSIPNSVISIGNKAFYGCSSLTSIYADSPTPLNLISSTDVFYDVNKTTCTLYVPIESKSLYIDAYQWGEFTNIEESSTAGFMVNGINYFISSSISPKTVEVAAGGTYTGAVTIPASVSCNSIIYSVTSIGNYAFNQCTGLSSITLPGSVTSIGNYAFNQCTGLNAVTIPGSATSIGSYAFYQCAGFTSITIPSSVTSIGEYAFTFNSCLFDVAGNNSNFSSVDGVLYNKNQTVLFQCPVSKTGSFVIPSTVTSIGDGAFENCSGLTSVSLHNSVTFIGDHAFESCTGLTSFIIPNSVTYIGNYAYYKCTGLTSVTITATVITLPNTVTTIGDYAFDKCTGLISLYANSPTPINLRLNSNSSYTGFNAAITLYVPTGSKSLYASAPVWEDFTNIVEHIVTGIDAPVAANVNISVLQNYPNPFTSTTTIKYKVTEPGFVLIKVFNAMGIEVATLVNEKKPAGEYAIDWNALGFTSGIYFCKLQNGNFSEAKKMLLLR
jgi:hypothetical protein